MHSMQQKKNVDLHCSCYRRLTYIHICRYVYTAFTQSPTVKTIKNLAVVTLFCNGGPFSVSWPNSSNTEAAPAQVMKGEMQTDEHTEYK